jgi:hypothetical protein
MKKTYTMSPAALAARRKGAAAATEARGGVAGRKWLSVRLAGDTVEKIDTKRGVLSRDRYVASRV